jgi:hypothetical protein
MSHHCWPSIERARRRAAYLQLFYVSARLGCSPALLYSWLGLYSQGYISVTARQDGKPNTPTRPSGFALWPPGWATPHQKRCSRGRKAAQGPSRDNRPVPGLDDRSATTLSEKGHESGDTQTRSQSGVRFPACTVSENGRFLAPCPRASGPATLAGFRGGRYLPLS